MNIRKALVDDTDLIVGLLQAVQSVHVAGKPDVFKPIEMGQPLRDIMYGHLIDADTTAFIAEVGDVPVGYVLLMIRRRDPHPFMHAMQHILIDQISVNPEYRGQGIGKALMEQVYTFAREQCIDHVALSVWSFNEAAIRFYEREGFGVYNVRMEKRLE